LIPSSPIGRVKVSSKGRDFFGCLLSNIGESYKVNNIIRIVLDILLGRIIYKKKFLDMALILAQPGESPNNWAIRFE
jgi:hypothetical protein